MNEVLPKVSVVCAWYNRAEYLRETIESVLNQSFRDLELVIVNDGSTDCRVKEILDSFNDSRLKVIHQENVGFVTAISNAIMSSNAPFIAIHGSADISYPARIAKQYEVLVDRDDVVAVGCLVENILDKDAGYSRVAGSAIDGFLEKEALNKCIMMHGEVMFRRDSFDQVGGYREYFIYSQDRDLWCRLSRLGRIVVLDEILYLRYANIGGVSGNADKQILQRCLSHFSIYCHKEVLSGRDDPLEKYGVQAGLLYSGTLALQKDMLRMGVSYFRSGDFEGAEKILDAASKNPYGFISKIFKIVLDVAPATSGRVLRILFPRKT